MARKLYPDKWLFASTVGLALFGVVMVYSASAVIAERDTGSQYHYVIKQAIWTAIGFAVMLLVMQIDYKHWRNRYFVYGLLLITTLSLIMVFGFSSTNGAHRWIKLDYFSIQPSELSKVTLVIFLAYFLERRAGEEGHFWTTFLPCALVTALLAGLVVVEPDLGTAMMLGLIFVVMAFIAGARLKHLAVSVAPGLVVLAGLLILVPFRLRRLTTFLDPWADPQGSGFQIVQSLIAVGSGGPNGLGFAQGKQKMLFLPFPHSDFIFAVIGEELGLVGALAVLAVFALFLWRGLRASLLAPDRFGMLLSLGLVIGIVAQALFNMSVVLSLVPTKGIPLPFISYGGSSLVPTLAAVGILLNISQQSVGTINFGSLRSFAANAEPEQRPTRVAADSRVTTSRFG